MDKLIPYGFVMVFLFGLICLTVRYVRKTERAEVKKETSEAENEIITKQRDASIDNVDDAISMLTGKKRK